MQKPSGGHGERAKRTREGEGIPKATMRGAPTMSASDSFWRHGAAASNALRRCSLGTAPSATWTQPQATVPESMALATTHLLQQQPLFFFLFFVPQGLFVASLGSVQGWNSDQSVWVCVASYEGMCVAECWWIFRPPWVSSLSLSLFLSCRSSSRPLPQLLATGAVHRKRRCPTGCWERPLRVLFRHSCSHVCFRTFSTLFPTCSPGIKTWVFRVCFLMCGEPICNRVCYFHCQFMCMLGTWNSFFVEFENVD